MNNYNEEFGGRLRIERTRLEMNQAQFAALGGVAKLTQLKYEKGERVPSADYLYRVYQQGVDVGYLLTGERVAGLMPSAPAWAAGMNDKEKAFATISVSGIDLQRVIEYVETGLKTSGAIWSAKKKADLITSLYTVSRLIPFATDDESYAKAAEVIIHSWGLDDKTDDADL